MSESYPHGEHPLWAVRHRFENKTRQNDEFYNRKTENFTFKKGSTFNLNEIFLKTGKLIRSNAAP